MLLTVAAVLACERRPGRIAQRDTSAATAPDTIVRYVVRVVRRPSAMQRVTGVVPVRRALEPLDSILAVRVFDQRGAELSGVQVRWALVNAGAGAQLRPINTRTDSLGVSRVAFTPGRSASPQGPIAEVKDVGRIDFAVTVPVSSIRVVAEKSVLWSDEESIVGAVLEDDAGRELAGGTLSWGTTDTTVLHIRRIDSLHASVTGVHAGGATLLGWLGTTRGSMHLSVRPVVAGRFVTMDGGPVPQLRMEIRSGSLRDSVSVQRGRFEKRVELPPETDVHVLAAPAARVGDAASHEVHLLLMSQRQLRDLRIALVPTSWRVDAGTYEGRSVAIDAARAMRRTASGAPFWRLAPVSGRGPRKILGWRERDLPLRIAFDRRRSGERIASDDSISFWSIAAQMERDLGATLFVPGDMRGDTSRADFVRIEITSQLADGHTFVSWDQSGDINAGVVQFRHAATLRDPHVVTHELLHLLGFGHSTSWTTVSRPIGGREQRLTPEDVAYVQLAMRLRRLQQETGARPGLPLAHQ
jgi:hypothetical protein